MKKKNRTGEIKFKVNLDQNNVPESIEWEATDSNNKLNSAKAVMISIWDEKKKSSLKIDLWTKDMMVEEMKFFTVQILDSLSDSYRRATNDEKVANEMKQFARKIGKMSNVLK